jgi:hypothetical protein
MTGARLGAAIALLIGSIVPAWAGPILYTVGADVNGAPVSLIGMDAANSPSVATIVTPLGDGSIGFNGGLVGVGSLLYGIGNDSGNLATLYSFTPAGGSLTALNSDFNTSGAATGFVFQNGLAAIGGTLYGIGFDSVGSSGEALFTIGGGSASLVSSLSDLGGSYSALAYAADQTMLYGIVVNGVNNEVQGDYLVSMNPNGSNFTVVANLSTLDGSATGTHTGGLLYTGGGSFFDVFTDPNSGNGQLETIGLNGQSATLVYDTGAPLLINHGLAEVTSTPEPSGFALMGVALALLARWRRARCKG